MPKLISCKHQDGWDGLLRALTQADSGDEIQIEAGEYIGGKPLKINTGITIRGLQEVSLISSSNDYLIEISADDVTIKQLCFKSRSAISAFVCAKFVNNLKLKECNFDGSNQVDAGILIDRGKNIEISYSYAKNLKHGIQIFSSDLCIKHCHLEICFMGIELISSIATLTSNICNNNKYGIYSYCNEENNNPTADLIARNNQCNQNQLAGILLNWSSGTLEDNICNGNDFGIYAVNTIKDSNELYSPQKLVAIKNQCSKNIHSGILILSTTATLINNRCEYNKFGIVSKFNGHENTNECISLLIANGNECVENFFSGMLLEHSEVKLNGNSCINNKYYGLEINNVIGSIKNQTDKGNASGFRVIDYPLADFINLSKTKQCVYLSNDEFDVSSQTETSKDNINHFTLNSGFPSAIESTTFHVESFIKTGGCPHCFIRFWGEKKSSVYKIESSYQTTENSRLYTADIPHDKNKSGVEIIQSEYQLNNTLHKLFIEFLSNTKKTKKHSWFSSNHKMPQQIVAYVSAKSDLYSDDNFSLKKILNDKLSKNLQIKFNNFDFTGISTSKDFSDTNLIVNQIIKNGEKGRLRINSLLMMHAIDGLIPLLFIPLCIAIEVVLIYFAIKSQLLIAKIKFKFIDSPIDSCVYLIESVTKSSIDITQIELSNLIFIVSWPLLVFYILLAYCNRTLPGNLKFKTSVELLVDKIGFLNTWLKPIAKFIDNIEWGLKQRRHWTKIQIFGYKIFGIFGERPDVVVVVCNNVQIMSEENKHALRQLVEICPSNQALFIVTHMSGLSMLVDCWRDVWFKDDESISVKIGDKHHLIHDPESTNIAADTFDEKEKYDIDVLEEMFGWEIPDRIINSVSTEKWTIYDIYPSLIFGSNNYSAFHLEVPNINFSSAHDELIKLFSAYSNLISKSSSLDQVSFSNLLQTLSNKNPTAFILGTEADNYGRIIRSYQIYGRQAFRIKLAKVIFNSFKDKDNAKQYIYEQIACGELHHLIQSCNILEGTVKIPNANQHLTLHIEAACNLLWERLSLKASCNINDEDLKIDVLISNWKIIYTTILQSDSSKLRISNTSATRICTNVLKAIKAYVQLIDKYEVLIKDINEVITRPFNTAIDNPYHSSIWCQFLYEIRITITSLSGLPNNIAKAKLNKKFKQDWLHLPSHIKDDIVDNLEKYDLYIFHGICQSSDKKNLLNLCKCLKHRPTYLVANLSVLAIPYAKKAKLTTVLLTRLILLRNKLHNSTDTTTFIGIPSQMNIAIQQAAFELLLDDDFINDMVSCIDSELFDSNEIEGVALGRTFKNSTLDTLYLYRN
jgi:hypothetical protein